MKKLFVASLCFCTAQIAFTQNNSSIATDGKVIVHETIDITPAYNAKKSGVGTFLLATTKSGHKIFLKRSADSEPVFVVKDPKGKDVNTIGRRMVVVSEGRTLCFECYNVNRKDGTTEECFPVSCLPSELTKDSKRTQ